MGPAEQSLDAYLEQIKSPNKSDAPTEAINSLDASQQLNPNRGQESGNFSRGAKALAVGGGALLAFGITWGIPYGTAVMGFGSAEITTEAEVQSGKGEVVKLEVDMNKFPIRLIAAETNASSIGALNDKFKANFFGIDVEIPTGQAKVDRSADVDTKLVVQPGKVELSYDPETHILKIDASSASLSTEVNTITGSAMTTDTGLVGTQYWKEKIAVDAKAFKGTADLISSAFGNEDGVRLPIVQDIVDGQLTTQSRMESFLDFYMVTKVDEECTPLIYQIPNLDDYLKQNILTAVQGRVIDLNEPNDVLAAMINDPEVGAEGIKDVVANAEVIIPATLSGGADKDKIAAFDELKKSDLFKDIDIEKSHFTCNISEDLKLAPINEANQESNNG